MNRPAKLELVSLSVGYFSDVQYASVSSLSERLPLSVYLCRVQSLHRRSLWQQWPVPYAQKTPERCIAVVSEDTDFKLACARHPSLLHFQSLPRLTELVPGDDANIEAMRAIVQEDIDTLTKDIDGIVAVFHFYPSDDQYRISRTKYAGRSVEDLRIVRIGDGECALTFEGEMEAEHELSWMDWGYRGSNEEPEPWQREEWMIQRAGISGTAKVAIDRSKRLVKEVKWLELDSGEIEFHETPRRF